MFTIHTILYATDFSPPTATAFDLACSLARQHGARLIVLHVQVPTHSVFGDEDTWVPDPAALRESLWERLTRLRPSDPEVRIEYCLAEGDPVREIVGVARETACELIVIGRRGDTESERVSLGGVAEGVLRQAPCPVLIANALASGSGSHAPMAEQVAGACL
jgi:nucleotide-binding universal stress UspA family protein